MTLQDNFGYQLLGRLANCLAHSSELNHFKAKRFKLWCLAALCLCGAWVSLIWFSDQPIAYVVIAILVALMGLFYRFEVHVTQQMIACRQRHFAEWDCHHGGPTSRW